MLVGFLLVFADLAGLSLYGDMFRMHFSAGQFQVPYDFACFHLAGQFLQYPNAWNPERVQQFCPYMYPPAFLFVAKLLSLLPSVLSYSLWMFAGLAVLAAAAWVVGLRGWRFVLGLFSPALFYAVDTGQTGLLTSAMLLTALGTVEKAPALAGLAASVVIIKPQCGILLPIFFLAGRHYRAFWVASIASCGWLILSVVFFKMVAWHYYFSIELPISRIVLDKPWPQPYQGIMVSVFLLLRSLGTGIGFASLGQAVVSCLCIWTGWKIWCAKMENFPRMVISLVLLFLVTPYGYIYDLPCLGVALCGLGGRKGLLTAAFFALSITLYLPMAMLNIIFGPFLLVMLALVAASYPKLTVE